MNLPVNAEYAKKFENLDDEQKRHMFHSGVSEDKLEKQIDEMMKEQETEKVRMQGHRENEEKTKKCLEELDREFEERILKKDEKIAKKEEEKKQKEEETKLLEEEIATMIASRKRVEEKYKNQKHGINVKKRKRSYDIDLTADISYDGRKKRTCDIIARNSRRKSHAQAFLADVFQGTHTSIDLT